MSINLGFGRYNYLGPYISDGKFQTSVQYGKTRPSDYLDAQARLHDSAYATFKDYGRRRASDSLFSERTKGESLVGAVSAGAVGYGNQIISAGSNLLGKTGLAGLIVGGATNMFELHDYMINESKYKKEVLAHYESDPYRDDPDYHNFTSKIPGVISPKASIQSAGKTAKPPNAANGEQVKTGLASVSALGGGSISNDEYSGGRVNNGSSFNSSNSCTTRVYDPWHCSAVRKKPKGRKHRKGTLWFR